MNTTEVQYCGYVCTTCFIIFHCLSHCHHFVSLTSQLMHELELEKYEAILCLLPSISIFHTHNTLYGLFTFKSAPVFPNASAYIFTSANNATIFFFSNGMDLFLIQFLCRYQPLQLQREIDCEVWKLFDFYCSPSLIVRQF